MENQNKKSKPVDRCSYITQANFDLDLQTGA